MKTDANEKSECFLDELECRLDDLFALEDEGTECAEKDQMINSQLDDLEQSPRFRTALLHDKCKTGNTAIFAPRVQPKTMTVSPATETNIPPVADYKDMGGQIPIERTHPKIGTTLPREINHSDKENKTAVSKKEKEELYPKKNRINKVLLKFAFGGIFIVGGAAVAFLNFSHTFKTSEKSKPIAPKTTYEIIDSKDNTSEKNTVSPSVLSDVQRNSAASVKPQTPLSETPVDEKEISQTPPVAMTESDKTAPTQVLDPLLNDASEIKRCLLEWAVAWEKCAGENGNITTYMSFYSDDFRENGLDKIKWLNSKIEKNRKKEWIRIKLDNINVVGPFGGGHYEARFTQVYQSSNYSDISERILIWKNGTSGWQIIGIK